MKQKIIALMLVMTISGLNLESLELPIKFANDLNIVSEKGARAEVTTEEYEMLARVCMSECGGQWGEPQEGKIAVVETILNRCEMYDLSIKDVVTKPNQYSMFYEGEIHESVYRAVDTALQSRMYPKNMLYFRTKHYHDFGTPYKKIGNHYFSLEGES